MGSGGDGGGGGDAEGRRAGAVEGGGPCPDRVGQFAALVALLPAAGGAHVTLTCPR